MPGPWLVLGVSVLGVVLILALAYVLRWWQTRDVLHMDRPSPYDDEFDRPTVTKTLDWYILRHLEDQRRMPKHQKFLDDDREHNAFLNRYAVHHFAKRNIALQPVASTLTDGARPDDATHYFPRYFPDEELDSALVMFKHKLIAKRLLSTIGYLKRITRSRGEPLETFAELRPGYTPFVPDAYVTFYNDLVAEADALDREPGLRDKLRILAVRMIFPGKQQELDYWKDRKIGKTYQIPMPVARDAIQGWFYLEPSDIPMVDSAT